MRPSRPTATRSVAPLGVLGLALAVALTGALAGALAGCTGGDAPAPPAAGASTATSSPTPLSAYDSTGVAVVRADFCALVPPAVVERALGGTTGTPTSYAEGDRAELVPGLRDRSGEYDCTWRAADGTTARAWVFAPPVTRERARRLARAVGGQDGCRRGSGAAFGDPSVATLCRADGTRTAAYAGLFVDAWLSCSVAGTAPAADLRQRAGEWCVAVASAADTTAG